jgi:hypothetical protein
MQIKNICLLSVASGEISAVEDFTYDMTVATLDAPRSQKGHGVDSSKSAGLLPSRNGGATQPCDAKPILWRKNARFNRGRSLCA